MDLHLVLDCRRPLRAQVERQLREGIRRGRLRPGVRLPPTRLLASELGVSRGVVVEAYTQLAAEGYLVTNGSGGTRVASCLGEPRRPTTPRSSRIRFDLRPGLPDPSLFPRRAWTAATSEALRDLPDAGLLYGPAHGQRRLRHAVDVYLGRARAIVADEEQTFITAGTSHALTLLWTTLRAAGVRRVAHEDPAWERVHRTIIGNGLEPVPVRVDAKGLNVTDLYASDAQVVVVSPAHQYPSGVIMHPTRRIQLIRWALDTGGLIVEDDYDAEYRFGSRPIAPLRSSAAECVAYIGTTSKVLAPGLRLGWLLVPPRLAEAVAEVYSVSSAQPSVIDQAAFAALLENGDVDRHLRRTRRPYGARRATLLTAAASSAPALRITGGAAGLHVMAWLPEGSDEAGVVADAARRGIAVDGLHHACAVSRELGPALLLGYGAIATSSIPAAISSLAECLEGGQRMNRLSESSPAKRSMRHARGSFDQSHSALQPDAQTGLVTR